MSLALIAALPFVGALLPGLMIRAGRTACATVTGAVTLTALVLLLVHAPGVLAGEVVETRIVWLPGLGLDANFRLDALALLFAGLILGIGLLIILYARFYLVDSDPMGQFYAFLMLFQGAMTGIVLSDNILLLLIFWELTSLSSFLLIGYWKHLPEGRQGARMALATTGAGGFAMVAGMLILGQIAGSHDISAILTRGEAIRASEWYLPALILILLGAFTKSAQFPFHYWLPHAMAAPTPVSAYLHSATMVKAGLFLMARLWPVLAGTPEWFWIVTTTGLVTMVLGALIALYKDDLKALLAFSTVSHLGFVTFCLGLGTREGAVVAVFHVINHACFKAALFMTAGIVDHAAHSRDIRRLGGLATLMPVTFVIALLTGLSMAGIPFLNGFLSKEMMLEEAARTGVPWALASTLGALLSVAYSLRYVVHVFLGPVRSDYPGRPHDPAFGMWVGPALLALAVVAIGVMPQTLAGTLVAATAGAVVGDGRPEVVLGLWHGLTPALAMSVVALAGGVALLALHGRTAPAWEGAPRPEAKTIFEGLVEALTGGARTLAAALHDGALTRYLAILAAVIVTFAVAAFLGGEHAAGTRALTPVPAAVAAGWTLLVVATVAIAMAHRNRLLALVLVAVIGLMVSVGFFYLSAPDLGLTQLTVEVVTAVLMLMALNLLPATTPRESRPARRLRDLVVAGATGAGAGALAFALMVRDMALPTIAGFHLAESRPGGGGANVVNVILVDFRGYDTFGEIIVLGIAGLAILALTETILGGAGGGTAAAGAAPWRRAGDPHPLMMAVVTRALLPFALLVGIFIYLRGHNEPGGGFIAGLVVAIALVMQYMASGYAWADGRQRVDYQAFVGVGVLAAGVTGIGAWFNGLPFLTSAYGYVRIPPFQPFELATAMGFDLGVFLTVVGAVMLALASLSRLAIRERARARRPAAAAASATAAAAEAG